MLHATCYMLDQPEKGAKSAGESNSLKKRNGSLYVASKRLTSSPLILFIFIFIWIQMMRYTRRVKVTT